MAAKAPQYYYKIYDDQEQFNYFRTRCEAKKVRSLLKKYEKAHQEYYTAEFLKLLKQVDPKAELIDIEPISY